MTTERVITLSFTVKRLDYIAQVLQQRPYAEVVALLADIQQQINEQQPQMVMTGNGQDTNPPPNKELS